MQTKPLSDLQLADLIYLEGIELEKSSKDKMYPLILGAYDDKVNGTSLKEMETLRILLINEGYGNTKLLRDIKDKQSNQKVEYNEKLDHFINCIKRFKGYIFPIFYIHPSINFGQGIGNGLLAEIIQIIIHKEHSYLPLKSIVLSYKGVNTLEYLDYVHPKFRYEISNIEQAHLLSKEHLEGFKKWIKCRIRYGVN